MTIGMFDSSNMVFRSIGALTITCVLVLGIQKVSGQQTAPLNVAGQQQTMKIGLSLKKGTDANQALSLLMKLADRRTGETWIHFEPVAAERSAAKIVTLKEANFNAVADVLDFFQQNGVESISLKSPQSNGDATSPKDLMNVSLQVIGRVVDGKLSPGLSDALNEPPLSKLAARGADVRMMVADEKEVDSNLVRLSHVGEFQLHAFVEIAKLLSEKNPIRDCKLLVEFPFVRPAKGAPRIPARLVNGLSRVKFYGMRTFEMPAFGSPIGLPGPPHLAGPEFKTPGVELQSPGPAVKGSQAAVSATPHSRLRTAAQHADTNSQSKAAKLRRRGQSKADKDRARATLLPLVAQAFQAKLDFHQAELEALSKRVTRLKSLVTERQKARGEIIRRRVDELLNPDLRWNAATNDDSKPPVNPKPPINAPRPVQAVTATRTDHFYVTSDPFTSPVDAGILENVAKGAEAAFRGLTKAWFDQAPVAFANRCGIDVSIAPSLTNGRGSTTYRFADDGKVEGAMMHLEGTTNGMIRIASHEVLHLVLAAQFRRQLPRWIDEGISMTEDSDSLFRTQQQRVAEASENQNLIPLHELFQMNSYPSDPGRTLLMHAQSRLVVEWLLRRGGPRKLTACMRSVDSSKMTDQLPDAIVSTFGF